MIEMELDLLRENGDWQRVLEAYRARQLEQKAEAALAAASKGSASGDRAAEVPTSESSDQSDTDQVQPPQDLCSDGLPMVPAAECSPPAESAVSGPLPLDEEGTESAESAEAAGESVAWVSRIVQLDGIESPELSRIHGQLIAWGLLQFQLTGRTSGMQYQLTRLARHLLNRLARGESAGLDEAAAA